MQPLAELRNGARPLRRPVKVYGRRHGPGAEAREMHRQLFGTNENDIVHGMDKLTVKAEAKSPTRRPLQPVRHSPKKAADRDLQSNQPQHSRSPKSESRTPAHQSLEKATKSKVQKRQTSRRRRRDMVMKLNKELEKELEPLLSQELVSSNVLEFEMWAEELGEDREIAMIGYGTYGNVFKISPKDNPDKFTIWKFIQLETKANKGTPLTQGNRASPTMDFYQEVKVLHALEGYHGFAQVSSVQLVSGKWPAPLHDAYGKFLQTQSKKSVVSIESLMEKMAINEKRLYGVIEMQDAGRELGRHLSRPNVFQAYDCIWTLTCQLSLAERELSFEHRDLHESNVCFTGPVDTPNPAQEALNNGIPDCILGLSAMQFNIIDYTFSRLTEPVTSYIIYRPTGPYQNLKCDDKYAATHQDMCGMRAEKEMRDACKRTGPKWRKYAPYVPRTNVHWLTHILGFLILDKYTTPRTDFGVPGSSEESLRNQGKLWARLQEMYEALKGGSSGFRPGSADELLNLAMHEKGWLSAEDVEAFKARLNAQ